MEEYIQEALALGCKCYSASLAATSFFFVKKKDRASGPVLIIVACITSPSPILVPLVPVEQLSGGTVFAKLDLRSAYNLIRGMPLPSSSHSSMTSAGTC